MSTVVCWFQRMLKQLEREQTDTHTHTHTHTQDKYSNPRACAPRVNWRAGASQPSRPAGTIFLYIYNPGALNVMFHVVLNIRHMRKMCLRILSAHRILPRCPDTTAFGPLHSVLAGYIHGFGVPHTERTAYTGRWGYPISRGLRQNSSNGSLSCFWEHRGPRPKASEGSCSQERASRL